MTLTSLAPIFNLPQRGKAIAYRATRTGNTKGTKETRRNTKGDEARAKRAKVLFVAFVSALPRLRGTEGRSSSWPSCYLFFGSLICPAFTGEVLTPASSRGKRRGLVQ